MQNRAGELGHIGSGADVSTRFGLNAAEFFPAIISSESIDDFARQLGFEGKGAGLDQFLRTYTGMGFGDLQRSIRDDVIRDNYIPGQNDLSNEFTEANPTGASPSSRFYDPVGRSLTRVQLERRADERAKALKFGRGQLGALQARQDSSPALRQALIGGSVRVGDEQIADEIARKALRRQRQVSTEGDFEAQII
jgi:hypothetical protein